MNHQDGERHAIVIGASLGGLLTARVLADHVDHVTIVERDRLPDGPEHRRGVPQSRHLHVLLQGGLQVVEGLFPGLRAELRAAGAIDLRMSQDLLWLTSAGWNRRHPGRHQLISSSRELLEYAIRCRVLADHRISRIEATDVTGLVPSPGGTTVTGVRLRDRDTGAERRLYADLVVDASGRGSHAPDWLAELGYGRPAETVIAAFHGYATRIYRIPAGHDADWKAIYLQTRPPADSRMGILFPIEGDRWMLSVGSAGRDYPPTEEAGFAEFVRSLRSPVLSDLISGAEPLTPIRGYRRTENQRRHYERMRRWPARFLVAGDAVCAFNPVYGQGMSVAAQTASELGAQLRHRPVPTLTGRSTLAVQRRLAAIGDGAWLMSTSEDLRYPTTEGDTAGFATRLQHRYLDRVVRTGTEDPVVQLAFLDAMNLLAPPTSLFRPRLVRRVLRGPRRPPLTAPPTATPIRPSTLPPVVPATAAWVR